MTTSVPPTGRVLPRGYRPPAALRSVIASAHRTCLSRGIGAAVSDHLVILAAVALAAGCWTRYGPAAGLAATIVLAIPVGRQLRALECLLHEASHYNWSRRHRRTNDLLAWVLAALPTSASLTTYRESHLLHHGRFGTELDPDRRRYRELDAAGLDRATLITLATGALPRLRRYLDGWGETSGASGTNVTASATRLLAIGWVGLTVALPVGLGLGTTGASVAVGCWLLGRLVALPVLRFVAECAEHDYEGASSVVEATISNLGWHQRLLLHPHGDGFHTVHHLWPGVPHHRIAGLHRELMRRDPGFAAALRMRTRVCQAPRSGLTAERTG